MKKTALVTGGTGFLGTHLTARLLAEGWSVRVFDQHPPSPLARERIEGARIVVGDVADEEAVGAACVGMSRVFHLAAVPSIARANASVYERANVMGTETVMKAAARTGAEAVLHVSSSTVYGVPDKCPLTEDDPVSPFGLYGRSKVRAEEICRSYAREGLPLSIIRPRVIIGPGRIGIFGILFRCILKGYPVYLIGDGSNRFQFTDVRDMVEACLLATEKPAGETFNIGAEAVDPVRQDMEALIRHGRSPSTVVPLNATLARTALRTVSLLGLSPLVDEQYRIADRNFVLDTTRARRVLGWAPRYSNLDSLVDAFDWYVANKDRIPEQFRRVFWLLGRFRHGQQGAFQ